MSDIETTPSPFAEARELPDGNRMPILGLGVWQVPEGPDCENAVRWAIETGYRHVDTAQAYGNEFSVGRGLRDSGVPREEVFLTTKFYPGNRDPYAELEASLERLGTDHVDLYIVHWPQGGPTWAWTGMERAHEDGLARSIGVSNYSLAQVDELLAVASVRPVMNQVQFSAFEHRRGLLAGCRERGLAVTAYSSLGTGKHLTDPRVVEVAARVGRTPAQALLRWCVQRGTFIIPKSTHRERIEENAEVMSFELGAEEMAALDALDTTGGTAEALESRWWR